MSDKQLTVEGSQALADTLMVFNAMAMSVDVDYAMSALKGMHELNSRYDAMSVINPDYSPEQSEVNKLKAVMLGDFVNYIKNARLMHEAQKRVDARKQNQDHFRRMFGI